MSVDPKFNLFAVLYPYALRRLLLDQDKYKRLRCVFSDKCIHKEESRGRLVSKINFSAVSRMLGDMETLTGTASEKLIEDVLSSLSGWKLVWRVWRETWRQERTDRLAT